MAARPGRSGVKEGVQALALGALLSATACSAPVDTSAGAPAVMVQVTNVDRRDFAVFVDMVGVTLGMQDIPIRARVEGFLETMNFQEGRFVSRGDLLYTIDAQPFQAKLVEAQSQLAAAETNLAKAASDLARIRPLAEIDAVSQQDLDGAVAQEAARRAGVRASEAAVDLAEIQLSYTRIHAPIDGLMGLSLARPGEFVGRSPSPVVLNTLSDIEPIRVRFSISEQEYLILARSFLAQENRRGVQTESRPDLKLILADGSEHPHPGQVMASAGAIDADTGTYTLEAKFPNPNGLLLPGQFARVRAQSTMLKNVTIVPRRAVVELQGRFRVYLIGPDNIVDVRDVTTGPGTETSMVIESGLEGGETIIVEGLQKVRPGMKVDPRPLRASVPLQAS